MRSFDRKPPKPEKDEVPPLDPVAVTLAIWLGLVVSVTGLTRISANAAATAQDPQRAALAMRPAAMQFSPYGS